MWPKFGPDVAHDFDQRRQFDLWIRGPDARCMLTMRCVNANSRSATRRQHQQVFPRPRVSCRRGCQHCSGCGHLHRRFQCPKAAIEESTQLSAVDVLRRSQLASEVSLLIVSTRYLPARSNLLIGAGCQPDQPLSGELELCGCQTLA